MFPSLSQTAPRATRRTLSLLGIAGIIALVLLTIQWVTNVQLAGEARDAQASDPIRSDKTTTVAERNDKTASTAGARGLVEFLPRPSDEEERILAALAVPIDMEVFDLPLEDCLNFIAEYP